MVCLKEMFLRSASRLGHFVPVTSGNARCSSYSSSRLQLDHSFFLSRTTFRSVRRSSSSPKDAVLETMPAPGNPFHLAFPVHCLDEAKAFYGGLLGCAEGRSSAKWQDYSLHGHQIVCHWVGNDYRCPDFYNPVDGDEVPVPHFGLALTKNQFDDLAKRLDDGGVKFIIPPTLRFEGMPGEQWTMFFKDPSGNNLEFKAMSHPENLFIKYNVAEG